MGMSQAEAAKMSSEVIGLSGALSAWSGGQKSAADVAEILQGAMLGETDALKGLGISISAADIQQQLLINGTDKLTGSALEQAQALAVQQLIMAKSTDAQKAFGDGVQSTNEKMATQNAKFRELKETVGSFVNGSLNDYATWAMSPDGKGVTGFWKEYNERIDWGVTNTQKLIDKTKALHHALKDAGKEFGNFVIPGGSHGSLFGLKFHDGGVVPGRTGAEVPAILQAGETVLPIGARIGGGNTNVVIHAPNYVGDQRDLARALSEFFARGGALTNGRGGTLRPT